MALEFSNVEDVILQDDLFNRVNYNKLNKDYSFAIDLGFIIFKNSISTEDEGRYKFLNISRDDEQMSAIFEAFLRNFYKLHTDYQVKSSRYDWGLTPIENSNINLIPKMETDIELIKENTKIIIDAKYYISAFNYRFQTKKFISDHICQLSSYIRSNIGNYNNLRGILIYPSNGYSFYERYISPEGYSMEFKTVDLDQDWGKIKKELLEIIT